MCPSLFIYFKCSSARRTLADGHARREAVVRLARGHAIAHVGTVSLRHCSCSGCKRCDRVSRSGLQALPMSYRGVQHSTSASHSSAASRRHHYSLAASHSYSTSHSQSCSAQHVCPQSQFGGELQSPHIVLQILRRQRQQRICRLLARTRIWTMGMKMTMRRGRCQK